MFAPQPHPDQRPDLEELAAALIARHVRNSLPTAAMRERLFGALGTRANNAARVIFVVGAGASASRFWRAADLASKLADEIETSRDGYKAELRRLQRAFNLDPEDFETRLAALARTDHAERAVRARIQHYYGRRHPTLLCYELIAHLLKHRFADGVISFNFDELLDQSVVDEMGTGEHLAIVSPRDVTGDIEFTPQDPRYKPILIKPHGTASDPTSLRFTREAYHALPAAVATSIRRLLGIERCIIICVGFGLRSFDFYELLDEPKQLEIVNLSLLPVSPDVMKTIAKVRHDAEHRPTSLRLQDISQEKKWQPGDLAPADAALAALVDCIAANAPPDAVFEFRDHTRHRAITRLLGEQDLSERRHYRHYLSARAMLEMSLSLVKSRGVASVASLSEERGTRYYDMAVAVGLKLQWSTVASKGGLTKSDISNETYLPRRELDTNCDTYRGTDSFRAINFEALAEYVLSNLPMQPYDASDKLYLKEMFERLNTATEIEIRAFEDQICSRIFARPERCSTLTGLRGRTLFMLQQADFDQIAVAAETGEWLLKPPFCGMIRDAIEKRGAKMIVMAAFATKRDRLVGEFGSANVRVVHSPWWRNNRRMTIVGRNDVMIEGIYFARRLRSVFVSPVHLFGIDASAAWKNFALSCQAAISARLFEEHGQGFNALWSGVTRYEERRANRGQGGSEGTAALKGVDTKAIIEGLQKFAAGWEDRQALLRQLAEIVKGLTPEDEGQ